MLGRRRGPLLGMSTCRPQVRILTVFPEVYCALDEEFVSSKKITFFKREMAKIASRLKNLQKNSLLRVPPTALVTVLFARPITLARHGDIFEFSKLMTKQLCLL
jgi:hypothetical protein